MKDIAKVRITLEELVSATNSPVYDMCSRILSYLESHPTQRILTVGGLMTSINKADEDANILIQAAFTLTTHPFLALDVRYKLYDELIEEVIEELDYSTYLNAIHSGYFIDDDGHEIAINELNSRLFPYFINVIQEDLSNNSIQSFKK